MRNGIRAETNTSPIYCEGEGSTDVFDKGDRLVEVLEFVHDGSGVGGKLLGGVNGHPRHQLPNILQQVLSERARYRGEETKSFTSTQTSFCLLFGMLAKTVASRCCIAKMRLSWLSSGLCNVAGS